MTDKPTIQSPQAKALEQPQHRQQVIPNKKREETLARDRDPLRLIRRDGI